MPRSRSVPPLPLLLLLPSMTLTSMGLAGCTTGPAVPYTTDVLPGVGPQELSCVVLLSGEAPGVGSGVIVGPHRLLTARHVVEPLGAGGSGPFRLRVGFETVTGRVVTQGELIDPHGDWAIVEVDGITWPAARFAALHEPATVPGWRPAAGMPVVLAGYASRFFPSAGVDPRVMAPVLATHALAPEEGPDGGGDCWYCASRDMNLAGMSGGAVFVRAAGTGRLELIGVFVARTAVARDLRGPFGLRFSLGSDSAERFVRLPAAVRGP